MWIHGIPVVARPQSLTGWFAQWLTFEDLKNYQSRAVREDVLFAIEAGERGAR